MGNLSREVFPDSAVITPVKDQVCCDLDGESVILNLQDGVYYGLNQVGSVIWALIREPMTVGNLRERLLDEYEVEPQQCEEALRTFSW